MGKILAICISEKKGTQKKPIESARLVEEWGIEGDAHVGKWHRQVSMLSFEKIEAFREKGADVDFGAFGENLVVEGFDLSKVPVGTKFQIGEAILELTQIGKECHSHCAIYKVMGIADAIRQYSLSITGRAMLSRAVSGIRKKTVIVNLP